MRLLAPKERESKLEEQKKETSKKSNELAAVITEEIKKFNEFRENIRIQHEVVAKDHDEFLAEAEKEKLSVSKEINGLKKQRDEILPSLEKRESEVSGKEKLLSEQEIKLVKQKEKLAIKELELTTRANHYEEKLDELADREAKIESGEESLLFKDKTFAEMEAGRNQEFNRRAIALGEKALELKKKEEDLEQVEAGQKAKFEEINKQKVALEREAKHISSRQTTLKAAFDEARKKGIY